MFLALSSGYCEGKYLHKKKLQSEAEAVEAEADSEAFGRLRKRKRKRLIFYRFHIPGSK